MYKSIKKYSDGGDLGDGPPNKTAVAVKSFYNSYLNSPKYKERLVGQGYKDPDTVISDRLFNVNRVNIGITNSKPGPNYVGSNYQFGNNIATIDNADKKYYHVTDDDLYSHELGHAAGAIATRYPSPYTMNFQDQKLINSKNKYYGYTNNNKTLTLGQAEKLHDAQPDELKADMDNLRYRLYKDKIYDTGTQDFNQQFLDKAKTKYTGDGNFDRLKARLSDKDLILLMNKVAVNKPQQQEDEIPIAAYGGKIGMYKSIKKYADGGNFYSNNQNAIIAGGNFLGSAVDSLNNQQNPDIAMSGFSGALKGAAAGTAVLPGIGTAVGAGVGLLTGVIGGSARHSAYMKAQQARWNQISTNAKNYSDSTLRQYDVNGISDEKLYADGGPINELLSNDNGIPIPRIKLPKTSIDFNKLQIRKLDPILGNPEYFGAPNGTQNIPGGNIINLRATSDKMNGTSNLYYPARNQARGKAIETVHTNGYFKNGGDLSIKPENKGKFNAYLKRTGKTAHEALHSKDAHVRKMANYAINIGHTKKAYGGDVSEPYEVEQGEVVQGNPTLEESTELASDIHRVGGERHEDGGTMGYGGERVFSDRLKISNNLKDILKTNGISVAKKSTYADVSNKIGKLKGKLEEKKDSAGKNSAQLMMPRLDQALDDTFNDQEMGKGYNKNIRKFASGGKPYRNLDIISGVSSNPSDISIDTTIDGDVNPINLTHTYTPNQPVNLLSSVGDFLKNNTGQVANAANYLSNMSTIGKLDTQVKRSYVPVPQYNYTDRSGYAYNRNNSALNTGIRSLSGTGRTVNAANIGQLYAKTLDSNSNIALNEAARRDAYNENYNQRLDRVNTINSQIQNEASDQQRTINNEKIGLQLGAKNALLTGIQGNIASKKAEAFQNKQLLAILSGNDQNGVMTRFLKNYPTYKKLLNTYNSTTE